VSLQNQLVLSHQEIVDETPPPLEIADHDIILAANEPAPIPPASKPAAPTAAGTPNATIHQQQPWHTRLVIFCINEWYKSQNSKMSVSIWSVDRVNAYKSVFTYWENVLGPVV
jgi:hypothetical protein